MIYSIHVSYGGRTINIMKKAEIFEASEGYNVIFKENTLEKAVKKANKVLGADER